MTTRPMPMGPIRPMPTPHPHRSRHSVATAPQSLPLPPQNPPAQKRLADKPQAPFAHPTAQKRRRGSRDGNLSSMIHQNSDNCPSSFGFGGAKTPMIKYGSGAFFMCHSYDVPRKRYKSSSAIFKYFSLTF